MPDQLSRKDIKQVDVLVYATLENPGEHGMQNLQKIFYRRIFRLSMECNLSAATLCECERNLRNNLFPHRSISDKLQLTQEQVRIIKHDVKVGEITKIVAFAGKMFFFLDNYIPGSAIG